MFALRCEKWVSSDSVKTTYVSAREGCFAALSRHGACIRAAFLTLGALNEIHTFRI